MRTLKNGLVFAICLLAAPSTALAQRTLHWARLDVSARLDAAGALEITETHTMIFTGEWNGGERRFDVRPGQRLRFVGISREVNGGWTPLREDSSLNDVDDYGWSGDETLRWRIRRRSDPPLDAARFRYQLRYVLTGVLQRDGEGWRLSHDFAFPDRDGPINLFSLQLAFDPAWEPPADAPRDYNAKAIAPGRGFVVTLPLQSTGAAPPIETGVRREIRAAVQVMLTFTALATLWFFVREERLGRFAPLTRDIDEAWLRRHILSYPAEVAGAAWDHTVGSHEVVALIARLVAEGKLESTVTDGTSMRLRLKTGRDTFTRYERALIDKLFFDGRTETTTDAVKQHYREDGFDPAKEIRDELLASVERIHGPESEPRRIRVMTPLLLAAGAALLGISIWNGRIGAPWLWLWAIFGLVLAIIGAATGLLFRAYINWGRVGAAVCLLPAFGIAGLAAWYLTSYADSGVRELPLTTLGAIGAFALALINAVINTAKSRQSADAIALRKTLASGRAWFAAQLMEERPALRDEWYPWVVAFELADAADAWSARHAGSRSGTRARDRHRDDNNLSTDSASSTSSATVAPGWTGFSGGRSGGAGAGASWAAAAGGLASGVSAASSSSSSDSGGSSYSSSDSSSSSSGGGGGGGW